MSAAEHAALVLIAYKTPTRNAQKWHRSEDGVMPCSGRPILPTFATTDRAALQPTDLCRLCWGPPIRRGSLLDRFLAKVDQTDGCWLWTGRLDIGGYGRLSRGGRHSSARAHRVAYELYKGPLADAEQVDHLCRTRHCVNPDHLEAVSFLENVRRGRSARQGVDADTQCGRGHEFTPENTYWDPKRANSRSCRRCRALASARYAKRQAMVA